MVASDLRIIYQNVLSELSDIINVKRNKQKLNYSLLINTRCKGCSRHFLVSLRGYVRLYCNKSCWKWNDDTEDSGYDEDNTYNYDDIYDKYYYILDDIDDIDISSKAISKRHRSYYDGLSPSGKVWPMLNKPCYNLCILNS